VPAGVVAQDERIREAIGAHRIRLGQIGDGLTVDIELHQPAKDQRVDIALCRVARIEQGIEPLRHADHGLDKRAATGRGKRGDQPLRLNVEQTAHDGEADEGDDCLRANVAHKNNDRWTTVNRHPSVVGCQSGIGVYYP